MGGGLFPDLGHDLSELGIKGKLIQKYAGKRFILFKKIDSSAMNKTRGKREKRWGKIFGQKRFLVKKNF